MGEQAQRARLRELQEGMLGLGVVDKVLGLGGVVMVFGGLLAVMLSSLVFGVLRLCGVPLGTFPRVFVLVSFVVSVAGVLFVAVAGIWDVHRYGSDFAEAVEIKTELERLEVDQ